jgi:riboflavin kinase/FMN adenylyltransferase
METLPGLEALPDPRIRAPVVTWGVFDGVHVGHRKVLGDVLARAARKNASSVVLTFDRHPAEVLTGCPVPLLTSLDDRLRLLGGFGIDFCVVLRFTREFSRKTAEDFVREVVSGALRATGVVLGHDSRFGRDRGGDFEALARLGKDLGLEVCRSDPEWVDGRPVSSSLIREAVAAGRIEEAGRLLGRPFAVVGPVVRGDRRGSGIGFPTANLELGEAVCPSSGVYVADARVDGGVCRAVANLGTRPTFRPGGPELLEVHLLDFPGGDLYGRTIEVRFLARLRDEQKFSGVEDLRRQIERDAEAARSYPRQA